MADTTPLDIANMALGLLTEAPIDSLDEDSRAARMLRLHYETTREAELYKRAWVFATIRKPVDPVDVSRDDGRAYGYELPADCLRVLPLKHYGFDADWVQEGSTIFTACGGQRSIAYIGNLIDPNDWPSVFTDVLVAAIAMKIAHPITGKANMVQLAKQSYTDAVAEAVRTNAVSRQGQAARSSWEEVRSGRSYGYGTARVRHGAGL